MKVKKVVDRLITVIKVSAVYHSIVYNFTDTETKHNIDLSVYNIFYIFKGGV